MKNYLDFIKVNYYIDKFEAIPEDQWITGEFKDFEGRSCAMGHCGCWSVRASAPTEGQALNNLFVEYLNTIVSNINDGFHPSYKGKGPKQNILAALQDIKEIILTANKPKYLKERNEKVII